jgi:hypothetical protein
MVAIDRTAALSMAPFPGVAKVTGVISSSPAQLHLILPSMARLDLTA